MKKIFKLTLLTLMIMFLIIIVFENAYAASNNKLGSYNKDVLDDVTKNETTLTDKFGGKLGNVYETIFTILRVLGVAGIVFTGIKYMYADGDAKGQIKKSLIFVIIGTIFVFAAGIVADSIAGIFGEVIK